MTAIRTKAEPDLFSALNFRQLIKDGKCRWLLVPLLTVALAVQPWY